MIINISNKEIYKKKKLLNPNWVELGGNHHPPLENRDFFESEHPMDLRPVCKLKFVPCSVQKPRALYSSRFGCGSPIKFEHTFFKIYDFTILDKIPDFLKVAPYRLHCF